MHEIFVVGVVEVAIEWLSAEIRAVIEVSSCFDVRGSQLSGRSRNICVDDSPRNEIMCLYKGVEDMFFVIELSHWGSFTLIFEQSLLDSLT